MLLPHCDGHERHRIVAENVDDFQDRVAPVLVLVESLAHRSDRFPEGL